MPGRPEFGVLKLVPYRILLSHWPTPPWIWTPADQSEPTEAVTQPATESVPGGS